MEKFSIGRLSNLPVVDLGEIYLRTIEYSDYKDMYEYGSDDEVTNTLMWDSYKNIEESKGLIESVFLSRPLKGLPAAYAIIHKKDNKMIGTCDFHRVEWDLLVGEIGYVLNRNYWGKGYMTLACNALVDFGFEYLRLNKIEISHEVNNIGSQRVIEKCGFIFIKEGYNKSLNMRGKFYEKNKG